jgi:hypothetical protein
MMGDMTARHIGENTQKNYIRCVKNLAAFIGRPPETATPEDLRLYRLHLVESPLGASSVNAYMTALRSAPSGASAQLYCLLSFTVQAATASTGPTEAKIRRKLLAAVAALPLKSP